MQDEISIPRERIARLPDADASDDAAWQPTSTRFSSFLCASCCRVPFVPIQHTKARENGGEPSSNTSVYCHHIFCSTCVNKGTNAFMCLVCKLELDRSSSLDYPFWHKRLRMAWSEIIVKCCWSGCGKKVPVDDLPIHELGCEHRLVKCHIPQCEKYVKPSDLSEHIEQCPHAIRH